MKTERLNCAVFILCSVTFVLQAVGYLAPAWFVKEYKVQHGAGGFLLDGKKFVLIGKESMNGNKETHGSPVGTPHDGMGLGKRSVSLDEDKTNTNDGVQQTDGDNSDTGIPIQLNIISNDDPSGGPQTNTDADNENEDTDPPITNRRPKPGTDETGGTAVVNKNDEAATHDNGHPAVDENLMVNTGLHTNDQSADHNDDQVSNTGMVNSNQDYPSFFETSDSMEKGRMMESFLNHERILHVTAGLWYGRACVNSRNLLTTSVDSEETEWCTLYIRTNESTLHNQKDVFEFRIEASIGLGICLVGMVVASSACCLQSRQGTRMVLSLTCMFISGAVMLIPVVHMIVQHQQLSGLFHRQRVWSRFMVHTYVHHDLFDHWSVVLCGCGSILSVLGSIIFTVIGYRNQRLSENIYDVSRSEKGTVVDDLPVTWARTDKLNGLSGKMIVSDTPDSLEDDSDYHTETKEENCPMETFTQDDSSSMEETNVETGSGNDVVNVEQTDAEAREADSEDDVEYFETVLDDD